MLLLLLHLAASNICCTPIHEGSGILIRWVRLWPAHWRCVALALVIIVNNIVMLMMMHTASPASQVPAWQLPLRAAPMLLLLPPLRLLRIAARAKRCSCCCTAVCAAGSRAT
jgi:hypothetical protein